MSKDISQYLEMQYLMFAPVRKSYIEHSELMDVELRKQQENETRSQAFAHELEELQSKFEGFTESSRLYHQAGHAKNDPHPHGNAHPAQDGLGSSLRIS